jgi:cytochrome c peroxidase
MEGAADPSDVAISPDGGRLFVAISGTHQVARVELVKLHAFIDGKLPDDHRLAQAAGYSPGTENIWLRIKRDPKEKAELVNDLSSLYAADLIERFNLPGKGPRGIALAGDGKLLAASLYFAGAVALLDPETGKPKGTISLGAGPEPDEARIGERIFHDATYCFQHWMSCATCHEEARVDGMNWDLLNDGIGNPKNARSLVLSHLTPPMMSLGVRSDLAAAVKAGFVHIQFHEPEEETLRTVGLYLESLRPERSPLRSPDGSLNEAAKRGEAIFLSPETECARCHPTPLYTDLKTYDVGTRGEFDRNDAFDTPTLIEGYRTAPFLHDGSAATMREVLVEKNKGDKHGKTSHLGPREIDDLVEFLLSL